ncbi:hypothetical protein TherJR_1746 [Thermincola potens JR]|uniref:Uncharacterized protein n=2 Tax=Thermincola TaxID=278993 RepID=D5X7M5_THEPJ|nr:hypothetical protein TherJR_1746 [Thermincola potens JR]
MFTKWKLPYTYRIKTDNREWGIMFNEFKNNERGAALLLAVTVITVLCILVIGVADISLLEARANRVENRQSLDEEKARIAYYLVLWEIKAGVLAKQDTQKTYDLGSALGKVYVEVDWDETSYPPGHGYGHPDDYTIAIYTDPPDNLSKWASEVRTISVWDKLQVEEGLHKEDSN